MKSILRVAGAACLFLSGIAHGQSLVVDRGLPTTNLNNAAGSNRSNVSWAIGDGYFVGDNFTVGGVAGTMYDISEIQTWVVARDGPPLSATLYTGLGANANLTMTSSTPTFSLVNYADGSSYQATGGAFRLLYQVNFTGLNIVAASGSTISFGVDGVNQNGYPFLNHASNAALSGSPQDGADNTMSYYYHDGSDALFDGTFDSNGNGWDKSSDVNVRVYASAVAAVPETATWAMMIVGFGAIGLAMRRHPKAMTRVSWPG